MLVKPLLLLLPDVAIDAASIFSLISDMISVAKWFLPLNTITVIGGLVATIWLFRVVCALLKFVAPFLPL